MNKKIKLAFCLFKFFPFGGLQLDFANISKECVKRGYDVDVYTMSWDGDSPAGLNVHIVPVSGWSNHRRYLSFAQKVNELIQKKAYDAVIGFNKMPGLDLYFAADASYAAKMKRRSFFSRMTRRYRALMSLEAAVFSKDSKTQILTLSTWQTDFYNQFYQTAVDRFHILPPGISKACIPPADYDEVRAQKRKQLGVDPDKTLILMVCSNFKIKGVARAIRALSSLPADLLGQTALFVAGGDNPKSYQKLAKKNGVADNVTFLGARKDVPNLLMASDLLLHPASIENAGLVLVEALTAHLPVITTASCGYAFHVVDANAGFVIPSPFEQQALDAALLSVLTSRDADTFRDNAKAYIDRTDVFSCAQKAVDIIEKVAS